MDSNLEFITINIGESGLAARLFTPIAAMSGQRVTVIGEGSMLRRPIGMMIEPLRQLGATVQSNGFLPITVEGRLTGGNVEVDGSVSSQFISGLLMALPIAERESVIKVRDIRSTPYLAMTVDLLQQFGIEIEHNNLQEFYVRANQNYLPCDITIETDWSSAAVMLVAGAIAGSVTVNNINTASLQADIAIVEVLAQVGAEILTTNNSISVSRHNLRPFEFDATHCPDLFPVLVTLASQCEGVSHIRGVGRLAHKESNRAEAILSQLGGLGITIAVDGDEMSITGGSEIGGECDSMGDHRIAMAAAVAGLVSRSGVIIHRAEAVNKSYPDFWSDLKLVVNGSGIQLTINN